jgi:hypothetical protein
MYSIDSAGNVSGQWSNGNPAIPTPGTVLDATWMNMLQAELLAILTAFGVTPVKGTNNQVLASLNAAPTTHGPASMNAAWTNTSLVQYRKLQSEYCIEGAAITTATIPAATLNQVANFSNAPSTALYGVAVVTSGGSPIVFPASIIATGDLNLYTGTSQTIPGSSTVHFLVRGIG